MKFIVQICGSKYVSCSGKPPVAFLRALLVWLDVSMSGREPGGDVPLRAPAEMMAGESVRVTRSLMLSKERDS